MDCRSTTREEMKLPWKLNLGSGVLRDRHGNELGMIRQDRFKEAHFAVGLMNNFKYATKESLLPQQVKDARFKLVREQAQQIAKTLEVTCECGKTELVTAGAFRCFHCGRWFCKQCMKEHIE